MTLNARPDMGDTQSLLDRLRAEHQALKERVAELEHHAVLTPEEQLECAKLKKLKLATKDQIYKLEHDSTS